MLRLSRDQLKKIMPRAPEAAVSAFVESQGELDQFGITANVNRFAFWVANVAHECGEFHEMVENGNYRAETIVKTWPSRFKSVSQAAPYAHNPAKLFNLVYGNRMGNGSPSTGDGFKYRGRGEPQVTGKDGYKNVGFVSGLPLLDEPDLASAFGTMNRVGGAFWEWKKLNKLADAGDFSAVVGRWNGGHIGMAQRKAYLKIALAELKHAAEVPSDVPLPKAKPEEVPSDVPPPEVPPIEANGEPSDRPARPPVPAMKTKAAQARLRELGHWPGAEDGDEGSMMRDALLAFQADNHLELSGTLDDATFAELEVAGPKHIPESRANADAKTLREKGSETISLTDRLKKWAMGLFGVGSAQKLLDDGGPVDQLTTAHDKLESVQWLLDPLKSVFAYIQQHEFLVLIFVGVAIWFVAHEIQKVRVRDEQTGANRGR
jgi:predicted chitinase